MDLLLIVFLTLLNGLFAMSELAVASSRKARLAAMEESGDAGAGAALRLMERPTQFLSTVQVGITSIGMLNGIVGEAAFSGPVADWLTGFGISEKAASISATALVVVAITFTTIIFGELVPKRIGQMFPETVARWIAQPMTWLALAAKPFVALLSLCTQWVLKLLRIDESHGRAVTEEEISASLEEGVDAGLIEEHEHQMVRNVFHLDDRSLSSLMVPRGDIEWLEADRSVTEALDYVARHGDNGAHSWYPVCQGSLDDVIGIISVAKLIALGAASSESIASHVSPAAFVPETLSGMELLEQLRAKSGRMVFIVDEYGVVQGLMTPRDLLEAITGELKPGAHIDAWATPLPDGAWMLEGLMPINELKARLDIDDLPNEDKGRYNTLAGLLLAEAGQLPKPGDVIDCAGWTFEVMEMEGRRIDRVMARPGTALANTGTPAAQYSSR
ncbi:hemolysin family protein [Ottowia testudinis]|uniref:HlyC/CorC family transporter n=1 Tax=Ottowia testudinis TaxID=2816950 RepID=A0A975H3S8_9BURK|nr:hemolysin family protein [Ottowia testudinis]QTD46129.1 HlyC/CorC family transporter [Ottowia testudinis]